MIIETDENSKDLKEKIIFGAFQKKTHWTKQFLYEQHFIRRDILARFPEKEMRNSKRFYAVNNRNKAR